MLCTLFAVFPSVIHSFCNVPNAIHSLGMGMDSETLKHVENAWKATKGDTKGSTEASAEGEAKGYAKGNAGECAPREGFQQVYL